MAGALPAGTPPAPGTSGPLAGHALNPIIGCLKAAEIARLAYTTRRPVIDVAVGITGISRAELERMLDAARLTSGGIQK